MKKKKKKKKKRKRKILGGLCLYVVRSQTDRQTQQALPATTVPAAARARAHALLHWQQHYLPACLGEQFFYYSLFYSSSVLLVLCLQALPFLYLWHCVPYFLPLPLLLDWTDGQDWWDSGIWDGSRMDSLPRDKTDTTAGGDMAPPARTRICRACLPASSGSAHFSCHNAFCLHCLPRTTALLPFTVARRGAQHACLWLRLFLPSPATAHARGVCFLPLPHPLFLHITAANIRARTARTRLTHPYYLLNAPLHYAPSPPFPDIPYPIFTVPAAPLPRMPFTLPPFPFPHTTTFTTTLLLYGIYGKTKWRK